jgi:hypothetical protein
MNIIFDDVKSMSELDIEKLFFNDFLTYGHNVAKYIAAKHDMSLTYCESYIASGLFMLMTERYSAINESNAFNSKLLFVAYLSTKKLVKMILGNTNYKSYDIKKGNNINAKVIDIVDVLEQKENRTSKKAISYDNIDNGLKDRLQSYYDTPETALLKKLSYEVSYKKAAELKKDAKINRVITIMEREKKDNTDIKFLSYFKKKHGIELISNKELFYLISNY